MDGTSKKCDSHRAQLPEKKCGLIRARNGYRWGCLVDEPLIYSVADHQATTPSFPRKRESSASAWIPGLRFTSPGMTGERWLLLFSALPDLQAWLASCGFRPPPEGPSPFLSTATKRDEKMPPRSSRFSCASRHGRGLADASLRAANAGHPWPAPAGLIRPRLRCSGGLKGKTGTARHFPKYHV